MTASQPFQNADRGKAGRERGQPEDKKKKIGHRSDS